MAQDYEKTADFDSELTQCNIQTPNIEMRPSEYKKYFKIPKSTDFKFKGMEHADLQADRDSLLKPLQAVTGIVERRHTLPILSNVLLESKDGQTKLLATDLEIQINTAGPESQAGDFRITTNAKKFQDILRALPDSALVSLDWADNRLTLRAGKSRFALQTLPAEDFPLMSVGNDVSATFSLTQETFKTMLSQVQYSMAVQDIRYYLNGLLMQVEGNQLRLVATDGHRLAYAASQIEAELPKTEVILPRKTVLELFKLLNNPSESITVELFGQSSTLPMQRYDHCQQSHRRQVP